MFLLGLLLLGLFLGPVLEFLDPNLFLGLPLDEPLEAGFDCLLLGNLWTNSTVSNSGVSSCSILILGLFKISWNAWWSFSDSSVIATPSSPARAVRPTLWV